MLIGLHGYPGTGKDTVAEILGERGYQRIAFADKIREGLLALNPVVVVEGGRGIRLRPLLIAHGWDKLKRSVPEVRDLLQRFGTEAGRHLHGDDVWIRHALREALAHEHVVVTDVRYPNEAAAIAALGGVIVNVRRPDRGPVNDHPSEQQLKCDYDLWNDADVDALRERVSHLVWWVNHRTA